MGMVGWEGLLIVALLSGYVPGEERIHARVVTDAGEVHSGFIRWGERSGGWADFLDGLKTIPVEHFQEALRLRAESGSERSFAARTIDFMGVRITWDEDDTEEPETEVESTIRFGHIRRLTVVDSQTVALVLKSGDELNLTFREAPPVIVVDQAVSGRVELSLARVRSIEFGPAPPGAEQGSARLHGTLLDRFGNRFTGYFTWDGDRILNSDLLVGRERRSEGEVAFSDVAGLVRTSGSAARVTLRDGRQFTLSDVRPAGNGNRGILISDPGLGRVRVGWADFREVTFHPPESAAGFDAFDGGRRLRGVVESDSDEPQVGFLRWDNDEGNTWEVLNGRVRGVTFEIELAHVQEIRRLTARSARVTLVDGRGFDLGGSNDVGWGNKGLVVERDDGGRRLVEWVDFVTVRFEQP